MNAELTLRVAREALILVLLISGGPMLASMLVGFVVGIFQPPPRSRSRPLVMCPNWPPCFSACWCSGPGC